MPRDVRQGQQPAIGKVCVFIYIYIYVYVSSLYAQKDRDQYNIKADIEAEKIPNTGAESTKGPGTQTDESSSVLLFTNLGATHLRPSLV